MFREVETELLCITYINFTLQRVKGQTPHRVSYCCSQIVALVYIRLLRHYFPILAHSANQQD